MSKVITFTPKVTKIEKPKGEVINIDSGDFVSALTRSIFALGQGNTLSACIYYNKALDRYLKQVFLPFDMMWLDILNRIYTQTGNFRLQFNSMARFLRFDMGETYLFNMWSLLVLAKQDKEAKHFKEYCIKNNLVSPKMFIEYIVDVDKFNDASNNNLQKLVSSAIKDINKQKFESAFASLHLAYELNRSDPFISYLYFNADESFTKKVGNKLPDIYIAKRLAQIKEACRSEKEFRKLWSAEDAPSLIRFLTNYGTVKLNERFLSMMFSNMTRDMSYFCDEALVSEGKPLLKKQLLILTLATGITDRLCVILNDVPRIVKMKDFNKLSLVHSNMDFIVIEALNVLLDLTDCYVLDLSFEINSIIKNVNDTNRKLLGNLELIRDYLVYLYFLNRDKERLKKLFLDVDVFEMLNKKFKIKVNQKAIDSCDNVLQFKLK